jgi:hypothetical protein
MEGNTPKNGPSDAVIRFNCSICGQHIRVLKSVAGKKGRCPKCKSVVVIPQSTPSPPIPPKEEPIRVIRDAAPSFNEPARPIYAPSQQWHRTAPEPVADIDAGTDKFQPPPEQKPATILNVFAFPFSLAGVLHFILFWFGPLVIGFLERIFAVACCYGQLMIIGLYIALVGYFYYYLSNCIIAAAKDERTAPDMSFEDTFTFVDLLRRVFLVLGCTFVCFGPLVLYMLYFYILPAVRRFWVGPAEPLNWRADPVYWLLYGIGVFLFPMFLLAVAMFDSITALNPFLMIGSIASTFLSYCGLALLFCAIGLLMNFIGQLQPGGLSLIAWGIDVYLIFIAAYILGRFYRRYEERLNWEIKL